MTAFLFKKQKRLLRTTLSMFFAEKKNLARLLMFKVDLIFFYGSNICRFCHLLGYIFVILVKDAYYHIAI